MARLSFIDGGHEIDMWTYDELVQCVQDYYRDYNLETYQNDYSYQADSQI